MILVCKNVENWHNENYKQNKYHYPMISKYTSIRLVNFFQRYGARIHFNNFKDEENRVLLFLTITSLLDTEWLITLFSNKIY
jgi:hypothetical protein